MQLQFYTKQDCPLCDEAKKVLESIKTQAPFIVIDEIDITRNMGLFTKYKHLIPVLELDGTAALCASYCSEKIDVALAMVQVSEVFGEVFGLNLL